MIKLRNITKSYRARAFKRTFVLRRVDLDIDEGEFVTIMGPSGAGDLHVMPSLSHPGHGDSAAQGGVPFGESSPAV